MVITPCEFERTTIDIQFALDSTGRISGLVFRPSVRTAAVYKPPSYANPLSFVEREMTIGSSEWVLPATLTVPAGTGPWPAVVLVHGSGPNDRDETVGANKPFSAWHSGSRRAVSSCFVTTSERWFTEPGCLGGMLILHGERDYQVTAEEFARWKAALDSRPDVTFESYPAPNHLFIAGAGPSLPAEYQVPGHVAEEVIHDIATWVVASR